MITMVITAVAFALAALIWCANRYFSRSQHGGSGEGALTVQFLIERIETETSSGRHQLRLPRTIRGDLADALAVEQPQGLPVPRTASPAFAADFATPSDDLLQCVLAGLRRL
ncbi:hypothetical protein ACWDKQ_22355 [Saccharopolyspora sp. NPDC000995]